jgi:hypothetical protein
MAPIGIGDHWIGENDERIPMTIEEKADSAAHGIRGIVSLARDARQSSLRAQQMEEVQSGESLLDIDPADVEKIMGDIPIEKLGSKNVIKAGKLAGMNFLRGLSSHIDLNPRDRKMFYLHVFNAMVAAIQSEDPSIIGTKN